LKCGRKLLVRYVSASGEETQRTVTPLSVGANRGCTYLVAMCHLRNEQRSFRLDRIVEMDFTGDSLADEGM
jgi:predicted DNA-binding transcriptional regulator YafY